MNFDAFLAQVMNNVCFLADLKRGNLEITRDGGSRKRPKPS